MNDPMENSELCFSSTRNVNWAPPQLREYRGSQGNKLNVSHGAIHLKVLTQFSQIKTRLSQNLPHRSYLFDVILLQASVSVM